ncbi:MAG: DUF4402 domain-containing protein [Rhizobacter sp.]|nr:DUF4402 domain-containing protein [Ferruginibacter sp.]
MQRILFRYKTCLLVIVAGLFFLKGECQLKLNLSTNEAALKVTVRQELQLGAFTQGSSGGSISVSPQDIRSASGTVIPLNFGSNYHALVLEIEGAKGAIVSMIAGETIVLTGSNGGTMRLLIKGTSPLMPFVINEDAPAKSVIKIGAELIAGNSIESPPGNYSGSLNISFIVE